MTKEEMVLEFNRQTKGALLTIFEALNKGQRQKLLKDERVKALFYRVILYYTILNDTT